MTRPSLRPARAAIALAFAAFACASIDVETQGSPGVDFSRLETFALAPLPPEGPERPRYTTRLGQGIHGVIAHELMQKGYREAPLREADLLVAFNVHGEERVRLRNAGQPEADFHVEQRYTEGSLTIRVMNPASGERLWLGVAQTDIFTDTDVRWAAHEAARAVLAEFPPAGAGGSD